MKEFLSFIFDKIIDPLTLPVNPLYEWLVLGLIGILAYGLAFRTVRFMYHTGEIRGRFWGSLFHWIVRVLFFIVIWLVVYFGIVVTQWIIGHKMMVLCITGAIIFGSVAVLLGFRYLKNRSTLCEKEDNYE